MTVLPEPTPTATAAGQAEPSDLQKAVDQAITEELLTRYRNDDPVPAIGTAPPVPQPDKRIVPAWAAGIAVASIGVGAGTTGIGCAAWLILKGLASVTLNGVLMVTLPIAAVAMLVTAIGAAINRARSATTTNIYKGTVHQKNINAKTTGLWAKNTNRQ